MKPDGRVLEIKDFCRETALELDSRLREMREMAERISAESDPMLGLARLRAEMVLEIKRLQVVLDTAVEAEKARPQK